MTKHEMRIAIALELGWVLPSNTENPAMMLSPDKTLWCGLLVIPFWTDDLNLCHQMLARLLNLRKESIYMDHLEAIVVWHVTPKVWSRMTAEERKFLIHNATSEQRCIAFIKTVGRWKD